MKLMTQIAINVEYRRQTHRNGHRGLMGLLLNRLQVSGCYEGEWSIVKLESTLIKIVSTTDYSLIKVLNVNVVLLRLR